MSKKLSSSEARALGIIDSAKIMPNGERRARITNGTLSASVTVLPREGRSGWQAAHYHKHASECYLVYSGFVVLVSRTIFGTLRYECLEPGKKCTVQPGISHALFLTNGAELVTIKHTPQSTEPDWHRDTELDQELEHVDMDSLGQILSRSIAA